MSSGCGASCAFTRGVIRGQKRHPREMGSAEVNAFLTHLAVEGQVSASTQNQVLSALLSLYRELLERDLDLEGVVRARKPRRLPVVLTEEEEEDVAAYLGTALQDGESQSRVMQVLAERARKSLYPPRTILNWQHYGR
jgi:site-specific recombinase XerD